MGGADGGAPRGAPEARAGGQAKAPRRRRRGGDAPPGGVPTKASTGSAGIAITSVAWRLWRLGDDDSTTAATASLR